MARNVHHRCQRCSHRISTRYDDETTETEDINIFHLKCENVEECFYRLRERIEKLEDFILYIQENNKEDFEHYINSRMQEERDKANGMAIIDFNLHPERYKDKYTIKKVK